MQKKTIVLTVLTFLLLIFSITYAQDTNFSGTWSTTWADSTQSTKMELFQRGNQVTGTYKFQNGTIQSYVTGNTLQGTWYQRGNNHNGTFEFTLSPGGNSFRGVWRSGNQGPWAGEWNGVRM